jgi:hypothetical protein
MSTAYNRSSAFSPSMNMNATVDPKTAETWQREDGRIEKIVEIEEEPRHLIDFVSDYTRIITTRMPPNDTTLAHRHTKDTIIIICMEDGMLLRHIQNRIIVQR